MQQSPTILPAYPRSTYDFITMIGAIILLSFWNTNLRIFIKVSDQVRMDDWIETCMVLFAPSYSTDITLTLGKPYASIWPCNQCYWGTAWPPIRCEAFTIPLIRRWVLNLLGLLAPPWTMVLVICICIQVISFFGLAKPRSEVSCKTGRVLGVQLSPPKRRRAGYYNSTININFKSILCFNLDVPYTAMLFWLSLCATLLPIRYRIPTQSSQLAPLLVCRLLR